MEYYPAVKQKMNNAICSNMGGPRDYDTKWSKSDIERQIPWYHLYMEFKIWHQSNLFTKHK